MRPLRALLVAVGVLPWLVAPLRRLAPAIGAALDAPFKLVCHRIPERTLSLAGEPMPVCSRCAGIYAGLALGALALRPSWSTFAWRIAVAVASALLIADVLAQDLGAHPIWHTTRLATGALFGYAIAGALTAPRTSGAHTAPREGPVSPRH